MTKTLEKMFLANVILYLETLETLYQFQMINSKCFDAVKMLRINPGLKPQNMINNPEEMTSVGYSFTKELQFFPLLETLKLTFFSPLILCCIPTSVKRIYLQKEIDDEQVSFLLPLKEKIVELKLFTYDSPIDLEQFPLLTKISLRTYCSVPTTTNYLEQFFTNKNHRFELVHVKMLKFFEESFIQTLNEYNIRSLVIDLNDLNQIRKVLDISTKCIRDIKICCSSWIEGLNSKVVTVNDNWTYQKNIQFEELLKEMYIPKLNVINLQEINLKKFDFLRSLSFDKCEVDALNLPKEIHHITLKESDIFHIEQLTSLQELILINCTFLSSLPIHCTKLKMDQCLFNIPKIPIDNELKELDLFKSNADISYFTNLTNLCFNSIKITNKLPKMNQLKRLSFTRCVIKIQLDVPSSVTQFCISTMSDKMISLSEAKNIKRIKCVDIVNEINLDELYYYPVHQKVGNQLQNIIENANELICTPLIINDFISTPNKIKKLILISQYSVHTISSMIIDLHSWESLNELWIETSDNKFILPITLKKLLIKSCYNISINNLEDILLKEVYLECNTSIIPHLNSSVEKLYFDTHNKEVNIQLLKRFPHLFSIE
ncbi:hypothetical protein CL6EHI_001170 [Entamoeba histolytica]|uniref:Leucine-rich repeat containing protein n=2 Tax=Entamoeba histolytica TaxID=5759 RepID=C4M1J5_ENTH1|nr:hypothetical protein EHI_001170 [Entamoeba histolytica HM-1:IMSS]EAL44481.2 hypothetical protein EHI_001170 [Entamoeba histolytica HM-1:IMSS]GAT95091.1 hypothetical protein CL6EHI_001170 [Entamoeba histolytica]|eukprot:XP_649867.2 hypothetical protein EHI_001170 [Entamoeba histolytica HM-1:IMSS]